MAGLAAEPDRTGAPAVHGPMHYRFENVAAQDRCEFMRYFDLYLHRGGG